MKHTFSAGTAPAFPQPLKKQRQHMAMAIQTAKPQVCGTAPGFGYAQVSGELCTLMAMLETCWWPTEAAVGGRYLHLAMTLFKMLRSSKAEISASCRKEENKFFTVSYRPHLISSLQFLWAS